MSKMPALSRSFQRVSLKTLSRSGFLASGVEGAKVGNCETHFLHAQARAGSDPVLGRAGNHTKSRAIGEGISPRLCEIWFCRVRAGRPLADTSLQTSTNRKMTNIQVQVAPEHSHIHSRPEFPSIKHHKAKEPQARSQKPTLYLL